MLQVQLEPSKGVLNIELNDISEHQWCADKYANTEYTKGWVLVFLAPKIQDYDTLWPDADPMVRVHTYRIGSKR